VGGEDKLIEVLDALPPSLQGEALAQLRARDPALAQRLRQRVVCLEDLLTLDPSEIKTLARRVPARILAAVLRASPPLRESLLPKLASGMRAWIEQEIELSQDLPAPQIEAHCVQILDSVRQLAREGRIRPHKQGA
jgi:flagellar motor switch protein FliG